SRAGRREQHYIRSRVAAVRGDQAGAVREMLELLKDYPREKDALLTVGIYFYQQHDYEQALAYLHRAIAIDSSFKQALNQIAYTYDKLGYFDSALAALDRYQEIAPNEANPYDSRGSLLAERGRFKEALAAFEQALAVRPDFYSSLWQAAFLYLYDHNYARSEELLQKIASSPNKGARCGGRTYLSYIPVYEGDFARALQMLDDGIAADRIEKTNIFDAPRKHLQKAMIYDELGDPQAAVNEAMLLVQGSANLPSHDSCFALPYLVQFQVRNGDLDAARRTAERLKACEAASSDSATYSWYADGWIKRASGDPTGAIASFKRAAELVDDFPTRYMLGVAFLESHQYEQAAATLEPLTRMHGSWRPSWCTWNVRLHYYLGWAYEELGNVTEARRQYGVFLDFWGGVTPEMPVVTETRTRLARLGTTP
ncbi:MAG: tetratricopeptide repeat protein, partial [candidate division Zixibacteria bacterium]|nr:tetratricopeptide repeat protein [candidate division Zixibacteria bacterium]